MDDHANVTEKQQPSFLTSTPVEALQRAWADRGERRPLERSLSLNALLITTGSCIEPARQPEIERPPTTTDSGDLPRAKALVQDHQPRLAFWTARLVAPDWHGVVQNHAPQITLSALRNKGGVCFQVRASAT